MSWSVGAIGKTEAVAKKMAEAFAAITYLQGPEAELKDAAAAIVAKALAAYQGVTAVQVTCNGSASSSTDSKTQAVNISIGPIYGFIE